MDVLTVSLASAALALSLVTAALPWLRRPTLSLHVDSEHSHVEQEGLARVPYLRLPVRNGRWRRSAKQVRVVLEGYRPVGEDHFTRLGSPFLAWPSVFGQESDAYVDVLFPATERPVGVGRFKQIVKVGQTLQWNSQDPQATWYLHFELPENTYINQQRDWLSPGTWEIRLVVGADDGDARRYALTLSWSGRVAASADEILAEALGGMKVERLS